MMWFHNGKTRHRKPWGKMGHVRPVLFPKGKGGSSTSHGFWVPVGSTLIPRVMEVVDWGPFQEDCLPNSVRWLP